MKAAFSLISRAALVAGILTAASARSVSADSGDYGSSRGRSCWAHSRHKEHKHSVGHDHDRCDHDDDHDDDSTPTTTVPSGSDGSTTPDSGSSESTPTGGDARPVVDTPTTTTPSVPVDDIVSVPSDDAGRGPSGPVAGIDESARMPSSDGAAGGEMPTASVDSPSESPMAGSKNVGSADVAVVEPSETFAGGIVTGGASSLWWLIVLAIAVEIYRRIRKREEISTVL